MRADVIGLLRCPVCGDGLCSAGTALRCSEGHSFDVARQGYVNLLPGDARPGTADTAAMVAARQAFLDAGHLAGLRRTICDLAIRGEHAGKTTGDSDVGARCITEVGAGTAYYLAGVLDRYPDRIGLALDLSRFAARRAAKAHHRAGAVVCDVWGRLPIADACTSLVLDIFAPRNPAEFRRVLEPRGRLIVATPTPRHLQELVSPLGLVDVDRRKQERLETKLAGYFVQVDSTSYEETRELNSGEVAALVGMGPSAHHVDAQGLGPGIARLARTLSQDTARSGPPVTPPSKPGAMVAVTLSVNVAAYRPA